MIRRILAVAILGVSLSACSTWSTSSVKSPAPGVGAAPSVVAPARPVLDPSQIVVTPNDFPNRPYDVLGDLEVTVNKTTVFHPDPTPALIDEKLREQAAPLGADAVILAKYGKVTVSLFSWGSLDGSGRAIRFRK
ncbi:hypothetical protein [Thalassobaculum sp.]|uniref:hypothetical protein n=1 Tax=Thalassobaculum sp. TaxID=2022740 RepID=UPI0032EBADFA